MENLWFYLWKILFYIWKVVVLHLESGIMDALNQRVIDVLGGMGKTKSELATLLDVSLAQLSHISSGRNKPGVELLQKLLSIHPKMNARWLLLGEGDKWTKEQHDEILLWSQKTMNRLRQMHLDIREMELELKNKISDGEV